MSRWLVENLPEKTVALPLHKSYVKACFISLFKKGEHNCPDNYRAISLLNCYWKLMEQCITDILIIITMTLFEISNPVSTLGIQL